MDNLLAALSALPTAIYTCLMGVAVLYWLSVIFGAFGLHVGGEPGGHDAGHDVGGHDAGHHGGHDGHNADGHHGGLGHGVFEFLSVGKVPITITLSATIFIAWSLCLLVATPVMRAIDSRPLALVVGAVFAVLAVVIGAIAAAYAVRPLRRAFTPDLVISPLDLVGKLVRVTSQTVDEQFGTAVFEEAGTTVILNVVCSDGSHRFAKHDQAVVTHHDADRDRYVVAPLRHLQPGFVDESSPPADGGNRDAGKILGQPAPAGPVSAAVDNRPKRPQAQ